MYPLKVIKNTSHYIAISNLPVLYDQPVTSKLCTWKKNKKRTLILSLKLKPTKVFYIFNVFLCFLNIYLESFRMLYFILQALPSGL